LNLWMSNAQRKLGIRSRDQLATALEAD